MTRNNKPETVTVVEGQIKKNCLYYRKGNKSMWNDLYRTPPERLSLTGYRPDLDEKYEQRVEQCRQKEKEMEREAYRKQNAKINEQRERIKKRQIANRIREVASDPKDYHNADRVCNSRIVSKATGAPVMIKDRNYYRRTGFLWEDLSHIPKERLHIVISDKEIKNDLWAVATIEQRRRIEKLEQEQQRNQKLKHVADSRSEFRQRIEYNRQARQDFCKPRNEYGEGPNAKSSPPPGGAGGGYSEYRKQWAILNSPRDRPHSAHRRYYRRTYTRPTSAKTEIDSMEKHSNNRARPTSASLVSSVAASDVYFNTIDHRGLLHHDEVIRGNLAELQHSYESKKSSNNNASWKHGRGFLYEDSDSESEEVSSPPDKPGTYTASSSTSKKIRPQSAPIKRPQSASIKSKATHRPTTALQTIPSSAQLYLPSQIHTATTKLPRPHSTKAYRPLSTQRVRPQTCSGRLRRQHRTAKAKMKKKERSEVMADLDSFEEKLSTLPKSEKPFYLKGVINPK